MPEKTMKEQKKKYGFRLWPDINQIVEDHKYITGNDRSAFVTEAIKRYSAEIDGEKSLDVLCDRISKIVSAEADGHSNRMAHMLFKIAVELSMQNYLLSAGYVNLDDAEIRFIRNKAKETVRKTYGYVSFEKALQEERALSCGE